MQVMSNYNYLIDEKTQERLETHGLIGTVEFDCVAETPREWHNSIFVGADTPMRGDIAMGDSFSDYVANYCQQVLDCKESDIVWLPVYKYSHSGVAYATTSFNNRWDSGLFGFIYQTKMDLREEFCVKRLTKSIIEQAKKNLEGEIKDYSVWANGDVYSINITNDSGSIDEYRGWLTDEGDNINSAINDLISECCDHVDRVGNNYELHISSDATIANNKTIVRHLNEQLDEQFGFVLTTGEIKTLGKPTEVIVNISFDSMPSVFQIADKYDGNFIQEISQKAAEIYENRMTEPSLNRDIYSFLLETTDKNEYSEWSRPLIEALFEKLLDDIEGLAIGG